jgi:hypothetical protein
LTRAEFKSEVQQRYDGSVVDCYSACNETPAYGQGDSVLNFTDECDLSNMILPRYGGHPVKPKRRKLLLRPGFYSRYASVVSGDYRRP